MCMQNNETIITSSGKPKERRTTNGLILPIAGSAATDLSPIQKIQRRLKKLVGDLTITPSGLKVPATPLIVIANGDKKLHLATDTEVKQYVKRPEDAPAERSGSEMALAEFNLPLFLSKEVKKKLGNHPQAYSCLDEVITNIEELSHFRPARPTSHRDKYSREILQRRAIQAGYYDKAQNKRVERTVTKQGSLEAAAMVMTELLQEPSFYNELGDKVVVCLSELMKDYRTKTGSGLELPEMPDLVHSIAESINNLSISEEARFRLYDVLNHINISPSLAAEVIEVMDKHKDLDHPLAYRLTLAIAETDLHHPWIQIQEERRNQLLAQLNASNQNLFDMYEELKRQSRGLVFSSNIAQPLNGKVGMEIEYGLKQNAPTNELSLKSDWTNEQDGNNGEVRRSGDVLEYSNAYRRSLTDLSKWLEDEATHISSIHLHFDKHRHPNRPDLGNLYQSVGTDEPIKENDLETWEIRALLPPFFQGKLQPARINDAIELYLYATTGDMKDATSKIAIGEKDKPNIDRLIFGHVSNQIHSPECRLALLMALHTPFMMQGVNPFAFVSSFDKNSIPSIFMAAKRAHIDSGTRSPFIKLLEIAYDTNFGEGLLPVKRGIDESQEQAFIRQVMKSDDPSNFAKAVQETYFVNQVTNKLRANQTLTKEDLIFLYGVNNSDRPYERDSRIKTICVRRNFDEDASIIFNCHKNQIARSINEINDNTKVYIGRLVPNIFKLLPSTIEHVYTSFPEGEVQIDKLTICGISKSDLERMAATGRFHSSNYALSMIRNEKFTTLSQQEEINTVKLTVGDFGFTSLPTTDELFRRAEEFGLELCPAEVGPHLRLKDTNQPLGEWYYIAMKQITDSDGDPDIFKLAHNDGGLWLNDRWASPEYHWNLAYKFVFRLRK